MISNISLCLRLKAHGPSSHYAGLKKTAASGGKVRVKE